MKVIWGGLIFSNPHESLRKETCFLILWKLWKQSISHMDSNVLDSIFLRIFTLWNMFCMNVNYHRQSNELNANIYLWSVKNNYSSRRIIWSFLQRTLASIPHVIRVFRYRFLQTISRRISRTFGQLIYFVWEASIIRVSQTFTTHCQIKCSYRIPPVNKHLKFLYLIKMKLFCISFIHNIKYVLCWCCHAVALY